ncbi:transmembrane protein 268 [Protopterus annectens]|uniref:transmembrane protein 268 n=1 Tax=Protopterus annectens TaxID=7888 RepID=UPI001CF9815B|nr:transmembrane protein 268 [Protopterus annectens]
MKVNIRPTCPSFSKTLDEEWTVQLPGELQNGQILASVVACNSYSSEGFDIQGCVEKLKSFGIEIEEEECKAVICNSAMDPQIRRYMFFSSNMFLIVIAVACYLTMWANIYSIVGMFPFGSMWFTGIFITIIAAAFTGVILLYIAWHNKKVPNIHSEILLKFSKDSTTFLINSVNQRELDLAMDINTDLHLAAVNENWMKRNLLVGITDVMNNYTNAVQLCFVYFNLQKCLHSLSDFLDQVMKNKKLQLKQKLQHLCIVTENIIIPLNDEGKTTATTEDSPLLSSTGSNNKKLTYRETVQLIPEGTSEIYVNAFVSGG